jgi:hypothetical protein
MPDEGDRHLVPKHTIRTEQDLWDEFGEIVRRKGDSRSDVISQMIAAFLKRPGVKIPRRSDYEPPKT